MTKAIYFDMDGTIANLYGVENWLEYLTNGNAKPYAVATPLVNLNALARRLNNLQRKGYTIGIISWLAKNSNAEYDEAVTKAKMGWLARHMKSVEWDEVKIVPYGTPKEETVNHPMGILFDDEEPNRKNWKGQAFSENQIMEVLGAIA